MNIFIGGVFAGTAGLLALCVRRLLHIHTHRRRDREALRRHLNDLLGISEREDGRGWH